MSNFNSVGFDTVSFGDTSSEKQKPQSDNHNHHKKHYFTTQFVENSSNFSPDSLDRECRKFDKSVVNAPSPLKSKKFGDKPKLKGRNFKIIHLSRETYAKLILKTGVEDFINSHKDANEKTFRSALSKQLSNFIVCKPEYDFLVDLSTIFVEAAHKTYETAVREIVENPKEHAPLLHKEEFKDNFCSLCAAHNYVGEDRDGKTYPEYVFDTLYLLLCSYIDLNLAIDGKKVRKYSGANIINEYINLFPSKSNISYDEETEHPYIFFKDMDSSIIKGFKTYKTKHKRLDYEAIGMSYKPIYKKSESLFLPRPDLIVENFIKLFKKGIIRNAAENYDGYFLNGEYSYPEASKFDYVACQHSFSIVDKQSDKNVLILGHFLHHIDNLSNQ